ncbi:hypothetical protein ZIOFF_075122 [Zingiber officinale]|uniref:Cytochrome f n=1 Tax=Zingiber officinale TaxID=94328 RepID=A0A8J5BU63_ZINOF|nr:hypothetical protein ZIOFF_075122 [Zingiber officinale]
MIYVITRSSISNAYPVFAQQGYENPREATGRIVCANCHLANKPVDIEVPQAVLPDTVFEAVVRIPYDKQLKQVLANGKKGGPVPGQKYSEIIFPILSPDPATKKDVHFLKNPIYVGGNRGRGQIYPDGSKSHNTVYNATSAGVVSRIVRKEKGGYEITVVDPSDGHQVVDIVPPGPELLVSEGESIKLDQPLTSNPNVGGFGQGDAEVVLQDPLRVQVLDRTNPLTQIVHGRKLSYLGPGGLTGKTASFRIRDIHPSHYGRICPIDTSEGINVGLIGSLAIHVRIGHRGSIKSPFYEISERSEAQIVSLSPNRDEYYRVAAGNSLALNQSIQEEQISRKALSHLLNPKWLRRGKVLEGTPGNRSSGDGVGPVAQRIRARGYEPRSRGFESLLAHNLPFLEGPFPLGPASHPFPFSKKKVSSFSLCIPLYGLLSSEAKQPRLNVAPSFSLGPQNRLARGVYFTTIVEGSAKPCDWNPLVSLAPSGEKLNVGGSLKEG